MTVHKMSCFNSDFQFRELNAMKLNYRSTSCRFFMFICLQMCKMPCCNTDDTTKKDIENKLNS